MSQNDKSRFFDGIASKWDGWEDLEQLARKLDAGLEAFGMGTDEAVLDVGCGTGNLTRALLARLSSRGRVTAVDISPEMVRAAKEKVSDPRVTWHVADAVDLPLEDAAIDRVICFSVWPHFDDHILILKELWRVLKPAGMLHIWHLASRRVINEIHASAGAAVHNDLLAPATDTKQILERSHFHPSTVVEDDTHYLVSAVKPPISK